MGRLAIAAIIIATTCLLAVPLPAQADTLIIGGRQVTPAQPISYQPQGDFLAPLLAGLDALGSSAQVDGPHVTITDPKGNRFSFAAGEPVVTVNGNGQRLELPPALVAGELWLPCRAACRLLGAAVRWEQESRTLLVLPKVLRVGWERAENAVVVTLEASVPISAYNTIIVSNPERIVVDLQDADLAGSAQVVECSEVPLLRVRLSQNRLNPDVVRLVLEVTDSQGYGVFTAEGGCQLMVRLPAPPRAIEGGPPAALSGAKVEAGLNGTLHLVLAGTAPLSAARDRGERAAAVTISIPNVLPSAALLAVEGTHPLFGNLQCEPRPEGGTLVTVRFASPSPYAVYSDEAGVHVVAGQLPLGELVVVLDPGHGGNQPGAPARVAGNVVYEKTLNLDLAKRVASQLQAAGAEVRLTRESDTTVVPVTRGDTTSLRADLDARIGRANEVHADLFVSIHCNANGDSGYHGVQTYYLGADSLDFAQLLQGEVAAATGCQDGGIRKMSPARAYRVLAGARVPAVLLETGFLSNPDEAAKLVTPEYREKAARGIGESLRRYVAEGYLLAYRARRANGSTQSALPNRGGTGRRPQR